MVSCFITAICAGETYLVPEHLVCDKEKVEGQSSHPATVFQDTPSAGRSPVGPELLELVLCLLLP